MHSGLHLTAECGMAEWQNGPPLRSPSMCHKNAEQNGVNTQYSYVPEFQNTFRIHSEWNQNGSFGIPIWLRAGVFWVFGME
jgi:hypothetical protein